MQYFEIFSAQVNTFSTSIDAPAIMKHYRLWKRQLITNNSTVSIEQYIRDFISEHLPRDKWVNIATLLPCCDCNRMSKWLASEGIDYQDTLIGLYINPEDIATVKTLAFEYSPIAPIFQQRCEDYGITVCHTDVYHFVRALPRAIVHKNSYHPVYSQYKEFFQTKETNELYRHIDRWAAIHMAGRPSTVDGYTSLAVAAVSCHVAPAVMLDWLNRYHATTTICIHGQILVEKEYVAATAKTKMNLLKDMVAKIVAAQSISNPLKAKMRQYIYEKIGADAPEWLIKDADFPGVSPLEYVYSRQQDEAYRCISDWINEFPCQRIINLCSVSNLKQEQIKHLIEIGTISAKLENNSYYTSNNEIAYVQQFNATHVAVDDLLEHLVNDAESNFNIKLIRHRQNLRKFLTTTELSENLLDNSDWLYPMDAKLTGLLLPTVFVSAFASECKLWLQCYQTSSYPQMIDDILATMTESFPKTAWLVKGKGLEDKSKATCDMLLTLLRCLKKVGKELIHLSEDELEQHIIPAFNCASVVSAKKFSSFIYEAKITKKQYTFENTGYHRDDSAYPKEFFAYMVAAVVDDDFWIKHDLVKKAVNDSVCAALWLNVAMHVMAAWRTTDFVRLPVPELKFNNQLTLQKITDGTYTAADARLVTELYEDRINRMRMRPKKTKRYINVSPLYFHIPESCKEPMGIILSIAAAHYGLNDLQETEQSFVRNVNDAATIQKFFGYNFLKACGNRNFSGKRANKSFMQGIEAEARKDGLSPYVSFMMASDIRSHKYYEDSLSRVTTVYLEDGKFSGYSKEYILEQMFERGIMSFIISGLLSMTYGDQYESLPISQQTNIIKSIGLTSSQVDDIVQCALRAETGAIQAIHNTMSCHGSRSPKETLDAIATGTACAKDLKTICLCIGAGIPCLCPERIHCLGCLYEVRSKNVLLHYLFNYDRQIKIVQNKDGVHHSEFEIAKSKWLIKNVLKPGITEIQTCMNTVSSKEEIEAYAWIMAERLRQYNQAPFDPKQRRG